MRAIIKKKLCELCESIQLLHDEILSEKNVERRIEYFQMCQESVIAIGEKIEEEKRNYYDIIVNLEDYCEFVYELTLKSELNQEDVERLMDFIERAKSDIEKIDNTYQVAFFPYQASMWDCLESVWKAFQADARFECHVVVIPYFQLNKEERKWEDYYEIDKFPPYVPVEKFSSYSLEENRPDFAFIHNPYDDQNASTRVHSKYFSRNLKKYVEKLFYVPYFVTTGYVTTIYADLYEHMDYIIVQSEYAKELYKEFSCYNKMIPLGSPKLDKIVRVQESGGEIPLEWKGIIGEKKVLMINTTISTLLIWKKRALNKLRSFFEEIREYREIVFIWRPHPLLEGTLLAMHPELYREYITLKNEFVKKQVGILDRSADISNTIAISDGYIGDDGSSIMNLFGVLGKPLFIFDYILDEKIDTSRIKKVSLAQVVKIGEKYWATSSEYSGIFQLSDDWKSIHYTERTDEEVKMGAVHPYLVEHKNKLYLSPLLGKKIIAYDTEKQKLQTLQKSAYESMRYREVVNYKNKIILIPYDNGMLTVFDEDGENWRHYYEPIKQIKETAILPIAEDIKNYEISDNILWLCASYSNSVIMFDMEMEQFEICKIDTCNDGISAIVKVENQLFLAKTTDGNIIKWDPDSQVSELIVMPVQLEHWNTLDGRSVVHGKMIEFEDFIITIPTFSSSMVKVCKQSNKVTPFMSEIFEEVLEGVTDCEKSCYGVCSFAMKADSEHLIVQMKKNAKLIKINVITEECEMFFAELNNESLDRLLTDVTGTTFGFEKRNSKEVFCKRESVFFSKEDFMKELLTGELMNIKEKQQDEMSMIAENIDGSCGEKIFEFAKSLVGEI